MPNMNGYISGIVYGWKPATAQWVRLRGATITANGAFVTTSYLQGKYTFPMTGSTVINTLISNKSGYRESNYPGVPITVVANVILGGYDFYMYP